MKKAAIILALMIAFTIVSAQQSNNGFLLTGSVIYEKTVKMDIQLGGEAEQFSASLPKEKKSEKILHFTEEEALYTKYSGEEPVEDPAEEQSGMMIKIFEPDYKIYTDLVEKRVIEQKEFMSRVFLIESEILNKKWKMTGNQKTILDYSCMEAISGEEGKVTRAWFTPQISVSVGPGTYSNLPGLVLAVDLDEGNVLFQATKVELKPVDKSMLQKPGKGKKVTQEEFQAIVDEKMKEMGKESGGEGGGHATVVIKIQQ